MGRPTKPTELKLMEGNRGKRSLNRNEPDADYLDNLEPSAWLPEDAKVVWRELAFRLRKAKVLTILDVHWLEKTSVAIATWRKATLAIAGSSHLIEKNGDAAGEKGKSQPTSRPIGFVSLGEAGEGEASAEQAKGDAKPAAAASIAGASLNPWVIVQSMAFKQATLLMRDFGMSPAARSRVLIDPQLGLFGNGEQEKSAAYFTS